MAYQDPKYKNGTKWIINDEIWVVKGVWSISDDPAGIKNPKTDKIVMQKAVNGSYVGKEVSFTPRELDNKNPKFRV